MKFDELPCYSGKVSCLIVQASLFQTGSAFLNHSASWGGQVIFHDIPYIRVVALNGSCVLGECIICVDVRSVNSALLNFVLSFSSVRLAEYFPPSCIRKKEKTFKIYCKAVVLIRLFDLLQMKHVTISADFSCPFFFFSFCRRRMV